MADKRRIVRRLALLGTVLVLVGAVSLYIFYNKDRNSVPHGFVKGNGRLEATEVDIATKPAGRLTEVLVKEGDFVRKNQVVARMDTSTLKAQLRQAEAEVMRARQARQTAVSRVEGIRLRMELAGKELQRSKNLYEKGVSTQQQYDRDLTSKQAYDSEYAAAKSSVAEVDASIEAAIAQTLRLKADIEDCMLKSPIDGPVLTRLAEPGEVLPAGGKVLTIVDPTDVYMNVYLSENLAGRIPLGAEAKVVLDALSDRPFAARVAYVSEKAQFTPKEVEAMEERQKLVFRVTVSLQEYGDPRLKPGMPGVSVIRIDRAAQWTDFR
ncbi:MAG TPA: HlyD family efflux transporter periplasmic adaptor subunit [Deltaproteobacteria bacterium]|nr:HlyD family efflux transporter periplasmic adaptor subunit [Deltaproteobacteria bacterium]